MGGKIMSRLRRMINKLTMPFKGTECTNPLGERSQLLPRQI